MFDLDQFGCGSGMLDEAEKSTACENENLQTKFSATVDEVESLMIGLTCCIRCQKKAEAKINQSLSTKAKKKRSRASQTVCDVGTKSILRKVRSFLQDDFL